jgi:hypothetical protein
LILSSPIWYIRLNNGANTKQKPPRAGGCENAWYVTPNAERQTRNAERFYACAVYIDWPMAKMVGVRFSPGITEK